MRRALLCWLLAELGCTRPSSTDVLVASATSLRRVMPALIFAFSEEHPRLHVTATYGASGALRQQVVAGAPVDLVVFADPRAVSDLVAAGHARAATQTVVATNRLVLIGPAKGAPQVRWRTLDQLPTSEKLAIGDPRIVPAGRYAQAALERLGHWDALAAQRVYAADVGAVLAYVRRGEARVGIVYETEVRGVSDVVVLDTAEPSFAPPATLVGAVVTDSAREDAAQAFLLFLRSPRAQAIFREHGFGAP